MERYSLDYTEYVKVIAQALSQKYGKEIKAEDVFPVESNDHNFRPDFEGWDFLVLEKE